MRDRKIMKQANHLIAKYSRANANGIPQICFIGVVNPLNPHVETATSICDALMTAARYIPIERLGSTDDCGFSPFSIDDKPNHSSLDGARDVAFAKIKARVQGTKLASARLTKLPMKVEASV